MTFKKLSILSVFVFLTGSVFAARPECVNIGTRSEGWSANGRFVGFAQCADQVVRCGAIGSRSEGWYAYNKVNPQLIRWAQCANRSAVPQCTRIGTRSEGWRLGRRVLKYAQCADQVSECGAIGSRSEGWYAYDLEEDRLIGWDQCAGQ